MLKSTIKVKKSGNIGTGEHSADPVRSGYVGNGDLHGEAAILLEVTPKQQGVIV